MKVRSLLAMISEENCDKTAKSVATMRYSAPTSEDTEERGRLTCLEGHGVNNVAGMWRRLANETTLHSLGRKYRDLFSKVEPAHYIGPVSICYYFIF